MSVGRVEGREHVPGPLVVDRCFVVCVGALGLLARSARQVDGFAGIDQWYGEARVARFVRNEARCSASADRGRRPGVQLQPSPHRKGLVAIRTEERVDEREPAGPARLRNDPTSVLGDLQGVEHREQVAPSAGHEEVGIELGSERRRQIEQLSLGRVEVLVPPGQEGTK